MIYCLLFFQQACSYLPEEIEPNQGIIIQENRDYIELTPTDETFSETALLFYPGGLVDPHAYIEILSKFVLISEGYKVVIAKMPANLAVLAANKGAQLSEEFSGINRWIVAGHSLGGAMACTLVENNPDTFDGLILMAAYPASSTDLADWNGTVLSLYASNDSFTTQAETDLSKIQLPTANDINAIENFTENTQGKSVFHKIEGGIHSYFGSYGLQKGDGTASISKEAQQDEITEWMQRFFEVNEW